MNKLCSSTKLNSILVLFVFLSAPVFGDAPILQSYKQRFQVSDLLTKADLLRSARNDRMMSGYLGEFYEYTMMFVLDNYAQMGELNLVNNIVNISLSGLVNTNRSESLGILWRLFSEYPDDRTGADILVAMGILGKGNPVITGNINNYLAERNTIFRSGRSVDYSMISACIAAIMELGDSSSYPVLFESICVGYPEVISSEAYGALELIHGNLYQFLSGVIENNPPEEKFAAFKAGMNSERLMLWERGQLAELALEKTLAQEDDNIDMTLMRYASVLALTNFRWTRANTFAIRHYYRVQNDFLSGAVPKERFIEAIACLGAVGNSQATIILGLQLGLINALMQNTVYYDEEITLAIVQALGLIGDNAAFNQLMSVNNLPYPENIKAAAEEAIERLKW